MENVAGGSGPAWPRGTTGPASRRTVAPGRNFNDDWSEMGKEFWARFSDPRRCCDWRREEPDADGLLGQAMELEEALEWLLEGGAGGWEGLSGAAWADLFRAGIDAALAELEQVPLLETERKARASVAAEQLLVLRAALETPGVARWLERISGRLAEAARQAELATLRQMRQECVALLAVLEAWSCRPPQDGIRLPEA